MPELPEVETSRRGIEPHIIDTRITGIIIRNRHLRWPISKAVDRNLVGESITSVDRRAKYLLINTTNGTAILHLGMSGSVFMVDRDTPAGVHDHVDIEFDSGKTLRFRDPPRFGSLHWSKCRNKTIHHERRCRCRRWQYLWERSSVLRGYQPAPRRGTRCLTTLRFAIYSH